MQQWFLVRTARHREQHAKDSIGKLQLETYLPIEIKWHYRKRERIAKPLFARFLFTRFDVEEHDWKRINRINSVDKIICCNAKPLHVPDRQVDIIRMAEAVGAYDLTRQQQFDDSEFPIGHKVRIIAGPFIGLIGEVQRASPKRRIEILFSLLGRETRTQIERSSLALV